MFATRFRRSITVMGCAGLLVAAAGCGGSDDKDTAGSTTAAKTVKIGLVTDIGGLNDRSFNALANKGLQDAKTRLGAQGRVITSKSNADYVPNLSTLAQQKYDLVIGVGFLMADAMATVATKFPDTKFAIIDVDESGLKGKPTNVEGLLFKENESGYLAGYLAASYAKDNGIDTISSVGGQKIPPVDSYIAGYQAGAKKADPGIKTLNAYSQDFVDQAKCKEIALSQIERGSKVVFQVAGQCGLGAIDAAKEQKVQAIGVDADQAYLGTQVLTSAIKKIDVAVFDTIQQVRDGAFKAGTNATFDVKSGGAGIGAVSATGAKYADGLKEISDQIAAGEITIPSTVK